ncbi:hypothetical protein D3C72_2550640 [compost metagenome]
MSSFDRALSLDSLKDVQHFWRLDASDRTASEPRKDVNLQTAKVALGMRLREVR